jgi:gliding motility-associated-like protein
MMRGFCTAQWALIARSLMIVAALALHMSDVMAQQATLTTRGVRFWTGFPRNGLGAGSLDLYIAGAPSTTGTVSIPLAGWSTSFSIPTSGLAEVNVPNSAENLNSGTVLPRGVLVETSDSVTVFARSYQSHSHALSQVLPEPALGTSYRVDAYNGIPNTGNMYKSELLVVATVDGTQVSITPSVSVHGGGAAGVPIIVDLNAGETYQLFSATDAQDLTGTVVEATPSSGDCRPFAVIAGSACATVPASCQACDVVFEQALPRSAWGTRFYTAPAGNVSVYTYRILADQNNTSVSIGGGAPIVLNAGQTHEVNGATTPVCIVADKPVSVTQFTEGYLCGNTGDPSMLFVLPADHLSTSVRFRTPPSASTLQHRVGVVVPVSDVGLLAVDGVVVPAASYQAYPGCNDRRYASVAISAGVHRIESPNGFQSYITGVSNGEAYGASVSNVGGVPVQQDSTVCGAGPFTLNSPELLVNATWTAASDPSVVLGTGNSFTVTPTGSDSYTVTGDHAVTGCPRTFTYHVGVPLTIPTVLTANGGSMADVCAYEPVQLGLVPPPDPAWFQITWSPSASLSDATSFNPVATPLEDTWYTVTIGSPSGCGDMVDSIFVHVTPASILELSASVSDEEICAGEEVQLSSRALRVIAHDRFITAPSALWNAVQGGAVSDVCGAHSGQALYFNGNGQRYAETVGLNLLGGGEIRYWLKIADAFAPCDDADPGEDVVLEYSTNNGLSWSLLATHAESEFPDFTEVSLAIPVAAQSTNTRFRLRQLANSGAGQDNWAFDDLLVAKVDDTWLTYTWNPGTTVAEPNAYQTTATPTSSGWFTLEGVDPTAGCVYSDSVHVHVDPPFTLTASNDTTLCDVAGVQLHATPSSGGSITFAWTPNDGTLSATDIADPIASPSATTTYAVTATNAAGCTAQDEVTITVAPLMGLTVTAVNDTLCQGQTTQLHAAITGGPDLNIAWTGAGLSATDIADPIASPTTTTTYTCTLTHPASQCAVSASITVVVNTGYTANAGPDLTVCSALGHQLNVQHNVPNATYQWSPAAALNAANIQSPTIMTDATQTFSVTVTDANGCSVSDDVTITRAFASLPTQLSAAACADAPPVLQAPITGVNYAWSTPSGAGPSGAAASTYTPQVPGQHAVTITDAQGCTGTTVFDVTLHALPVVDLGLDQSLCGATSHVLNAGNAGSSFLWNTGGTAQQLTGTASDAVNVQFNPMPVNTLSDVSACATAPPTLDAGNAGCTYLWNTNATTQQITPTTSGTYSVTITTPQQCTATFSAEVDLAPAITVELGNDTAICAGTSLLLDAGNAGATHVWTTGATTSSIQVTASGTYGVTVSNAACTASDMITVTVLETPQDVLQDRTACVGVPVTLDAGNAGATYLWDTNANSQQITVTQPGTYTVTVTNANGCSATFDAQVTFVQPPVVALGADTVLCEGQSLMLDAGNAGSTYLWNTGATGRTIQVTHAGTYSVVVDNGHCTRSDEITIAFNPSPLRVLADQVRACLDDEPGFVVLDAGNPGSRFGWSTGETTQMVMASAYGLYIVEVTNAYDCTARDSVLVTEYCPSSIYVPNTFTPNNDGLNDIFIPVGKNIGAMHLIVFDRWGEILFESDNPDMGWDGTYRGSYVKNDIYVWKLTYRFTDKDGALGLPQERMGHIEVLR